MLPQKAPCTSYLQRLQQPAHTSLLHSQRAEKRVGHVRSQSSLAPEHNATTFLQQRLSKQAIEQLPPALLAEATQTLATHANLSHQQQQLWNMNISLLEKVFPESRLGRAVATNPLLLNAPLTTWLDFLTAYGVPKDIVAKVLEDYPDLMIDGSVYNAGCSLLFFRSMGWKHKHIIQRIIAYYPQLLLLEVEKDMMPVIEYVGHKGCYGENLKLLVWEYPRIFHKDYPRQVQKFQYLEVYGFSRPRPAS